MTELSKLEEELLEIFSREGMVDREKLTRDAPLDSLGVKSVDIVMILMEIEEKYGVYVPVDATLTDAKTVDDFVTALKAVIEKKPES